MMMKMMRLGGSEGPAINNNVEVSTRVHERSEMKGSETSKRNRAPHMSGQSRIRHIFFVGYFSNGSSERVVLTRS